MARPLLRTARLRLRPLGAADGPAIAVALNDLEITRWLRRVPSPYRAADFADFLPLATPGANWVIDDAQGLAGFIGLDGGLGYWLARDRWGRGYATEAARAVLSDHFAAPGATPVPSGYFLGNDASARVLAKLGFRPTERETVTALSRPGAAIESQRLILTEADWSARPR